MCIIYKNEGELMCKLRKMMSLSQKYIDFLLIKEYSRDMKKR